MHRDLYHTLFESYLTYGITVWGGASDTKLKPLFKAHKKVIRILFGDREKYLDKFKTCARTRPYPNQKLTSKFFIKEHSKPLFIKNDIINLKNLYFYHCTNEIFKIFKFKSPIAIYETFSFSKRGYKNLFIVTPKPSETFDYRASVIWNSVRQTLGIEDASTSISSLKERLKKFMINKQAMGDDEHWIECNFLRI